VRRGKNCELGKFSSLLFYHADAASENGERNFINGIREKRRGKK
jgi:hypothetical protein